MSWDYGEPWESLFTLTLDIPLQKDVGCAAFLAFGVTSVRVKYCNPTIGLGEMPMKFALNFTRPNLESLMYPAQTTHSGIMSYAFFI